MQDTKRSDSAGVVELPKWVLRRETTGRDVLSCFQELEPRLGERIAVQIDGGGGGDGGKLEAFAISTLRLVLGNVEIRLGVLLEAAEICVEATELAKEHDLSYRAVRQGFLDTYGDFRDVVRNVYGQEVAKGVGFPCRTPYGHENLAPVVRFLDRNLTPERREALTKAGPGYVRVDFGHYVDRLLKGLARIDEMQPERDAARERLERATAAREEAGKRYDTVFRWAVDLLASSLDFAGFEKEARHVRSSCRKMGVR